ncbi:MAG: HEPN domain-containing protein [Deltaproteobacteria bacterium]|nr:HEPN domain-containing protein [Deltaproteobacteria bacterium]
MGSINLVTIRLKRARQALAVAKRLFEEKFFNDSLSKSYYAIFYAAGAALESIGIQTKRHATTIQKFNEHFVKNGTVDKEYYLTLSNAFRT